MSLYEQPILKYTLFIPNPCWHILLQFHFLHPLSCARIEPKTIEIQIYFESYWGSYKISLSLSWISTHKSIILTTLVIYRPTSKCFIENGNTSRASLVVFIKWWDSHRFQSTGVSRISFIILKWLQLEKPLFALNGDRCVAFKIVSLMCLSLYWMWM